MAGLICYADWEKTIFVGMSFGTIFAGALAGGVITLLIPATASGVVLGAMLDMIFSAVCAQYFLAFEQFDSESDYH